MQPRPRGGQKQQPGAETDVSLPQTIGIRQDGALERALQALPDDDIDTVHAGQNLEPIPSTPPVARPLGTQLPADSYAPIGLDDSSTLAPIEAAPGRAVTETAYAAPGPASDRMDGVSGRTTTVSGDIAPVSGRAPSVSGGHAAAKAGRSSRRFTAVSGRTAAEPGSVLRTLLTITAGILLVSLAVLAVIFFAARRSEGRQRGTQALAEAERQFEVARTALARRRGQDARQASAAALQALTGEAALGGAVAEPPKSEQVVPDLAQRAFALRREIEALKAPIDHALAETAAEANLAALRQRLAKLADPATDLDVLERDIQAFCANPVDPAANDPGPAAVFPRLVGEMRLRLPDIAAARQRRLIERTTMQVERTRPPVIDLIAKERYGEALALLDAAKAKFTEADFAPLRDEVGNAAAKSWRSAKAFADTRIADWKSPGSTAEQRVKAVSDAKRRLNHVIDTFGMPEYVDQARALLATLP